MEVPNGTSGVYRGRWYALLWTCMDSLAEVHAQSAQRSVWIPTDCEPEFFNGAVEIVILV